MLRFLPEKEKQELFRASLNLSAPWFLMIKNVKGINMHWKSKIEKQN